MVRGAMEPKRIYLIDLDDTVVRHGTQELLPGVRERLLELSARGEIWYFSCWAQTPRDIAFLNSLGVPWCGIIKKPFAAVDYVMIDDKLNLDESAQSL